MKEEKKSGTDGAARPASGLPEAAAAETAAGRAAGPRAAAERTAGSADEAGAGTTRPAGNAFPTWVDLLVFLGIFLVSNLIGYAVSLLAGCSWPSPEQLSAADEVVRLAAQNALGRFNAVTYVVTMACTLAAYLAYRSFRGGPRTVGRFSSRGLNPMLLLWGVLFMFSTSVVLEPLLVLLPEVPNVYGRGVWAVVTLAGMAPLFAECLFRVVLVGSVRHRHGGGSVHGHPTVIVNAFFMGLILGFVYLQTGSLWSVIFLHAINNGLAYVLLAAGLGDGMLTDLIDNRSLYLVIYLVAAAVFLFSGFMTVRTLRTLRRDEKNRAAA